jgi:enoyl-[acyl-carrier protein] reductase I
VGLLEGKKGLVVGVANDRSIAWGIARAAAGEGASLAFTYQGEALQKRVAPLAARVGSKLVLPLDVTREAEIEAVFRTLKDRWEGLDFLVHAVAFANREDLNGPYCAVSRPNYLQTLDISAYSFTALARAAAPLMEGRRGSMLTLTYIGGERVLPNYNVMGIAKAALEASVRYLAADLGPRGIRVNAISAGPIKTLSAAGIPGFSQMLQAAAERAPLRRNVEAAEVGGAALFLLSDLASAVTGDILFVDGGWHVLGV